MKNHKKIKSLHENQNNNFVKDFGQFLESRKVTEAEAYDEPTNSPSASMRQEDWSAKDKLHVISSIAQELTLFIEDGEQLEESQRNMIDNIYDNINSLKRQLEGREEVKAKEQEDEYDKINNPNL